MKPMGQPVKWLISWAMPLTPPDARLAGIKNRRSERAWINAAKMMRK
jgi:hypothetical protein